MSSESILTSFKISELQLVRSLVHEKMTTCGRTPKARRPSSGPRDERQNDEPHFVGRKQIEYCLGGVQHEQIENMYFC
jgi:hypothetical protein